MSKKQKIGIDVDGVLRDFDTKLLEVAERVYPGKVNLDAERKWDFEGVIDVPIQELCKLWQETHCEEIFREAPMMPDAYAEFKLLRQWARTQKQGYSFACATAQMPFNACHTLYWLGKHYFNFMEFHISNNKHNLDIDWLIDDSPKNYDKWIKAGRREDRYIMFNTPANQKAPATHRIHKLSDAIEIFEKNQDI